MKKNILSIYILSVMLLAGCYDSTDEATVKINLGNLPVAATANKESLIDRITGFFLKKAYAQTAPGDIIKIHIAVMKGDSVFGTESINLSDLGPGYTAEIKVPAGEGRTILVVAENNVNTATYYGYTVKDLNPGVTTDVTINIESASWCDFGCSRLLTYEYYGSGNTIFWTDSGIKTRYYLKDAFTGDLLYSGYELQGDAGNIYNVDFYVEFEVFNLKGPVFNFNFG